MTNNSHIESSSNISLPGAEGAKIVSIYVERKMKVYAVPEPELSSISLLNTIAIVCFSVGSFLISQAIDLFRDKVIGDVEKQLSPDALAAYGVLQDIFIYSSVVLFIFGVIAIVARWIKVRDIKEQSKVIE